MDKIYNNTEICNFYCDESCHTKNDGNDFIVLVGLYCRKSNLKIIKKDIKIIKDMFSYGEEEIKWGNLRDSNYRFYEAIMKYIHETPLIKIRALIGNDKTLTYLPYEDWYHSMYFYMFMGVIKHFPYDFSCYRLFIDSKDTRSKEMYSNTAKYLQLKFKNQYNIEAVPVDSKEYILVQIADVFAGAISYTKRELSSNMVKSSLVNLICHLFDTDLVTSSKLYGNDFKFNLFSWKGGF